MMKVHFFKYHGIGNDYLFIDEFSDLPIPENALPELARAMSDRRKGIGSDGIVVISPDATCDASMRIFNADGSEAQTCGNALRCIARHLLDKGYISGNNLTIRTKTAIVEAVIQDSRPHTFEVQIDMGEPIWDTLLIPVLSPHTSIRITVDARQFDAEAVSFGNPHCVIQADNLDTDELLTVGPLIESHPMFPQKTNVEFFHIETTEQINMIVWERGSGMTAACGSGACAVFAIARKNGLVKNSCEVRLPGGVLNLSENTSGHILMAGPATFVFEGIFEFNGETT